ncbi:hypothetical protein GCM10009676_23330 [Prauserella halophila]|uniref:Uncharacterized protein n=1 Tax=Prauserella halophila TaxID=185641 RepID=A0ABN1W6P4_9PSEU|nr:hypothetical protein [Prauserella halophila]MCP2235479.1 hypothetical protein [Prauserella halophila]
MGSGDGTQAPESAHGYSDSLTDEESATGGSRSSTPPAQSTVPDLEVIRSKAAAALAAEDAKQADGTGAGESTDGAADTDAPETAETANGDSEAAKSRFGKIPRPRMRGQLLPAMLRQGQRPQKAQQPAATKPAKQPLSQRVTVRKPSNTSAGMIAAGVLLIVFVLVAIRFVVSFAESVGSVFS